MLLPRRITSDQGIRAGLAWNTEVAALVRQHNDANVLCLPVRFISLEEAKACLQVFLDTPFEGGRHQGRVNKIREVGDKMMSKDRGLER